MKNKSVQWIVHTAMGVALVIVAQYLGNLVPAIATIFGPFNVKQLITGTLVNCILLVFTAVAGLASGAVIGVLSSVLAAAMGISNIVVSPLVAVGNVLLCVLYRLIAPRTHHLAGMAIGAVVKCAFLWVSVPMLLGVADLPAQQTAMLSVMFSWPQGITALCGGLLSWPIIPRVTRHKT